MRWCAVVLGLLAAFTAPALPAAGEERAFFDGLEARMIGPYRGGRAMVAVGVRQDPHVYYMGTTGGVWKTVNAGATWEPVSDEDFGSAAVGAVAASFGRGRVVSQIGVFRVLVGQFAQINGTACFNLFVRATTDEHRLAQPFDRQLCARLQTTHVNPDGRQRQNIC